MRNPFVKQESKVLRPFSEFYKHITPDIFVYLFKHELVQSMAFVLSFCQNKKFIHKVLELIDNQDVSEQVLLYLSKCEEVYFNQEFTRVIEKWADKTLELYNSGTFSKIFRTSMREILPKDMVKENKMVDQLKEDLASIIDPVNKVWKELHNVLQDKENLKELESKLKDVNNELHTKTVQIREINEKRTKFKIYLETASKMDPKVFDKFVDEMVAFVNCHK